MKTTGYNSINSWGVAAACSFVNCLALLPMRVAGLLFVAFLNRYDTDRQNAALFVVINGVLATCLSPLIGCLGEIFELRSLIICGCFISSLGVGICYFAENIIIVIISLGVLYGIGIGLQLTLIPQILKQHFTKNIASANGVTQIGSCVGTFVVIPVFKVLLDMYGVSGALLIASGIMLHGVPVAMLLRDPKYKTKVTSLPVKESNAKEEQIAFIETIKKQSSYFTVSDRIEPSLTNNSVIGDNETCVEEKNDGTSNVYITSENKNGSFDENAMSNEQSIKNNISTYTKIHPPSSMNLKKEVDVNKDPSSNEINQNLSCKHSPTNDKRSIYIKALKTLAILRYPPFLVIMLCQSVFGYITVFITTIIIDISNDKGIPESQAQFFLMMSPVAQTFGYICLGWVTDRGYLTAERFLAIGSLGMGLSCCGYVFSNSFATMMFSVLGFGLCVSVTVSIGPSLVYAYVEETNQSMAIASRSILYAPLCFTMGPTIRFFRGSLESYNGALYLLATFSVICSVLLLFLPCIARYTNRKNSIKSSHG